MHASAWHARMHLPRMHHVHYAHAVHTLRARCVHAASRRAGGGGAWRAGGGGAWRARGGGAWRGVAGACTSSLEVCRPPASREATGNGSGRARGEHRISRPCRSVGGCAVGGRSH